MTDYVPYTPDEYAPDAPATALHFQRWFENWIAGFQGAPGAPRINPIGAMEHQGAAGAVGTYVLARRIVGTADMAFGGTVAGSNIAPASAAASLTFSGGTTAGTAASPAPVSTAARAQLVVPRSMPTTKRGKLIACEFLVRLQRELYA